MYFFDKKIVYLIWKMQEGHARGVGSAKFLAMDGVCRIEITITGCGNVQGTYPVYMLSGDIKSLLGEITLHKGKGNFFLKCNTNALGHQAFPYTKVTGVYIDLMTEGFLEQKWLPMTSDEKTQEDRKPELLLESAEQASHVEALKLQEVKETETVPEQTPVPAKEPAKARETSPAKPPSKEEFQLYPSKWQQLCAIYPIVHPFNDGRAYLSIEPRDFVVLQERFQPMVQNSFLLHGFYHYRHLLLGRSKQGKGYQYYLGVPGVFYEKEKAAALFYGFESFEGAVTPAAEGSFGYYMKRVQI